MQNVSPEHACPKCGSMAVRLDYRSALDKLSCACKTCNYTWLKNPKDRQEKSPSHECDNPDCVGYNPKKGEMAFGVKINQDKAPPDFIVKRNSNG